MDPQFELDDVDSDVADDPTLDEDATWNDLARGMAPDQDDTWLLDPNEPDGANGSVSVDTTELPALVGDPASDMVHWHQQSTSYTCAVVAQEFILDSVTGQDFTEEQLMQEATKNGWLDDRGTKWKYIGELLEHHDIPIERMQGATMDDLEEQLSSGEKIIVGVHSTEIWNPGTGLSINDLMGYPGDADHAVQVIGIDRTDPSNPTVILNDSGTPNGQGLRVPMDRFTEAWEDSGSFMMYTELHGDAGAVGGDGALAVGTARGYYNADGTYHWTSDNTDRDPETGAIVRRW